MRNEEIVVNLGNSLKELQKWIVLVLVGVFAFWLLNNLEVIGIFFGTFYKVFFPFILGGVLAYVLNIPMIKIEKFVKAFIPDQKEAKLKGFIRVLAIVISLLLLLLIIGLVAFLLIPELVENIELLMKNIPGLIDKVEVFVLDLVDKYPDIQVQVKDAFSQTGNVTSIISSILNYVVNGVVGFVSGLVSGFVTTFTALIFAIYMLSQKEYLIAGMKKLICAYTEKRHSKKIMEIATLTNKTFSSFVSGQCVEAVILGAIIYIVSLLCGFPYALIIGVLTAITALIPIFGGFIAAGVGAVLIAITNPLQALIFIAVFLVVQQIEGNFIYPKVVGKSVGLSPLWTLLAITVGGNLFGVVGMLVGLPLASVVYTLLKENVKERLNEKK